MSHSSAYAQTSATATDSGYGIVRSNTGALVSVPWGRRCRSVSRWNQAFLCAAFNLVLLAARALRPHLPALRPYAAYAGFALAVWVCALLAPYALVMVGVIVVVVFVATGMSYRAVVRMVEVPVRQPRRCRAGRWLRGWWVGVRLAVESVSGPLGRRMQAVMG